MLEKLYSNAILTETSKNHLNGLQLLQQGASFVTY